MQRVREGTVEGQGGATIVEFTLVFPIFLALVTVMINYAITFWRYNELQFLADRVARDLSMSPKVCGTVGPSDLGPVEFLLPPTSVALREYQRYMWRHGLRRDGAIPEFIVKGNDDGVSFRVEASTPMGCQNCLMMSNKRLQTVIHAMIENKTC